MPASVRWHDSQVDLHCSQNHLLPFFTRVASGIVSLVLAALFAHVECSDRPHPLHELNASGLPSGPFNAVPRHSAHDCKIERKNKFLKHCRICLSKNCLELLQVFPIVKLT